MYRPVNISIGGSIPIMLAATAAAMTNVRGMPRPNIHERDGNGWRVVGQLAESARRRRRSAQGKRGKRARGAIDCKPRSYSR